MKNVWQLLMVSQKFKWIRSQAQYIWVDKGSESYKRSMKPLLQDNDIKMYLTHNEGKYLVAERFIRTLKDKISK